MEVQLQYDPIRKLTNRVYDEVSRATRLHKGMQSQHEAYGVIKEELDEFWDLVKINPKKLPDDAARAKRLKDLRDELIQTAAMCVRAVADLGLDDSLKDASLGM